MAVTSMLYVITLTGLTLAHVNLDILEMAKVAMVCCLCILCILSSLTKKETKKILPGRIKDIGESVQETGTL